VKSAEEIMNILEAYDLTGSLRDAAELAGCSHHTVARYVTGRDRGRAVPGAPAPRAGVIDEFVPKLESGTKWGRLRGERRGVRRLVKAGVPAVEVVGELVVEDAGTDLQ
jgi:hypothetical protein